MRIVKERFSALEAGYIIFLLKPYYQNFSKRFVKAPKLYFYDTGLLCYLLRLKEEDLLLSPYKEALTEVIVKFCHGKTASKYFRKNTAQIKVSYFFQ